MENEIKKISTKDITPQGIIEFSGTKEEVYQYILEKINNQSRWLFIDGAHITDLETLENYLDPEASIILTNTIIGA